MIRTDRRSLLAAVALAPLGGGCLTDGADEHRTEGHDDELIDADLDSLLLDAADLPGDGWTLNQERARETERSRDFVRGDETARLAVSRYESADAAETSLRAHRNEDNETEFESHEIGSAGYVQRTPFYDLSFRDANVRGSVSHFVDGGGDEEFVFDTAVTMHERWR